MIRHELIAPHRLQPTERERMLRLMQAYYLGVTREDFERDLGEKEGVIVLRDVVGDIAGFSTITTLDLQAGVPIKAIFSGDTIVESGHRHNVGLAIELATYFRQVLTAYPSLETYYLLISKGWRTARIPHLCFEEYAPSPSRETTAQEQQVIDAFGKMKYPGQYDARRGVITGGSPTSQRLRPTLPEALMPDRDDPVLALFLARNPGFLVGDELVFASRVCPENFTKAFRRLYETRTQRPAITYV